MFKLTGNNGFGRKTMLAFYQGLELGFVYGALTSSLATLGLVLCTHDNNLAPSALLAAVSKISEASLTKTKVNAYLFHLNDLIAWTIWLSMCELLRCVKVMDWVRDCISVSEDEMRLHGQRRYQMGIAEV